MGITELRGWLSDVLAGNLFDEDEDIDVVQSVVKRVSSFEDAGMLTRNEGMVLRLQDGSEFQITIVQSQSARSA